MKLLPVVLFLVLGSLAWVCRVEAAGNFPYVESLLSHAFCRNNYFNGTPPSDLKWTPGSSILHASSEFPIRSSAWPPRPGLFYNVRGFADNYTPSVFNTSLSSADRCFFNFRSTDPPTNSYGEGPYSLSFGWPNPMSPRNAFTFSFLAMSSQSTSLSSYPVGLLLSAVSPAYQGPRKFPPSGAYNFLRATSFAITVSQSTISPLVALDKLYYSTTPGVTRSWVVVDLGSAPLSNSATIPTAIALVVDFEAMQVEIYSNGALLKMVDLPIVPENCVSPDNTQVAAKCACKTSLDCAPFIESNAQFVVGSISSFFTGFQSMIFYQLCIQQNKLASPSLYMDDIMLFADSLSPTQIVRLSNFSVADRALVNEFTVSTVNSELAALGSMSYPAVDVDHSYVTISSNSTVSIPAAVVTVGGNSTITKWHVSEAHFLSKPVFNDTMFQGTLPVRTVVMERTTLLRTCSHLFLTFQDSSPAVSMDILREGLTGIRYSATDGVLVSSADFYFDVALRFDGLQVKQSPVPAYFGEPVTLTIVPSSSTPMRVIVYDGTGTTVQYVCSPARVCNYTFATPNGAARRGVLDFIILADSSSIVSSPTSFSLIAQASPPTPPIPAPSPSSSSLSTAAQAGIGVGSAVGGLLLICCLLVLVLCGCCLLLVLLVVVFLVLVVAVIVVIIVAAAALGGGGASVSGITVATKRLAARLKQNRIKLPKPDFEALAFSTFFTPMYDLSSREYVNYDPLAELLVTRDFKLAMTLANHAGASELDSVAKCLVYAFQREDLTLDLLKHFITAEVMGTTTPTTLFRQDCVSSKMFNSYARIVGLRYCFRVFALPVNELDQISRRSASAGETSEDMSSSMSVNMEVDPSKLTDASDAHVNTIQLWLIAEKMFSSLCNSSSYFPSELSAVLRHVRESVLAVFSEADAHKAMGGFLFLRFLCASLMTPHYYGLLEKPPLSNSQRQLILLGKVIQNLANDTLPGVKESYMERLNSFIEDNRERLHHFYEVVVDRAGGPSDAATVTDDVFYNAMVGIHGYLHNCRRKVIPHVKSEVDEQTAVELEKILDALGDPPAKLKSND